MEARKPRIDMPGPGERLNTGETKPARPAASVMVLREGEGGPEVLLVQRNPDARFMGGAWVFPGGAVHADDSDPAAAATRELAEEAGVTVEDPSALVPFSRWITPAEVEIRFDTFFYVVEAPAGAEGACDGQECVDLRWLSPAAALDAYGRDELLLVFPTIKHLEQLAEFGSVAEALEHARARRVQPVQPRVLIDGGQARVVLPGEPGYEDS
jgi:8-oxo-dGTP pyrophosphatase MutT (NUDIX family)